MDNKTSFFIKIKNQIRKGTDKIGDLFVKYAEEDGFLYIEIKQESMF